MAITAKTVTINDTDLTTEQQNQLQFNALATFVTNNDLMTESSAARSNTTLNTTSFTGNNRSIVNALNLLASNITSAIEKADTAVSTCNSVFDNIGISSNAEDLTTLKTSLNAESDATIVTLLSKIYDLVKNNTGSSSSSTTADTTTYLTAADLETALASYAKTADLTGYAKTTDLESYAKTTDLASYETTAALTETLKSYATTASVEEKIAAIGSTGPTFKVVETLPTADIDSSAIYLIKNNSSDTDNQYTEYYRVNDTWETFGVVTTSTTVEATSDADADALFAEQIEAEVTEDTSTTTEA